MESDLAKKTIATELVLNEKIFLSVQVVNEVCINLIKKVNYTNDDILILLKNLNNKYKISNLSFTTVSRSAEIRKKYKISYWDSLIIASALQNNCTILYTEDMQHNQIIEDTLKIINPFK
ncbi:MAG: PIN domain nuclease [Bacteroidetes bacterium]|nr:MAG: PIN domain nuclease [Bacteroidota bacterium]